MRIPLDRDSAVPLYRQIESYLAAAIQAGRLPPDTRLPSTRSLARDLGVSRITVDGAYDGLEADGLIDGRHGSGTYVVGPPAPDLPRRTRSWPLWQRQLDDPRASEPVPPAGRAGTISFADGVSDAGRYPIRELRAAIDRVLRRDAAEALGYGDPRGYGPLRTSIAQILTSQGVATPPSSVLITSGSQQALALVTQLLVRAGDAVVVERPTYGRMLELLRTTGARIVDVPVDREGMEVESLERLLQQFHPRLVYTMPNFQNPTGGSMSAQRRRLLVTLADRYNVPILEDDFVGDLRYEGRAQPALKALDPGGRVIYTSTFSKMLMPGVRVGFVVADGPVFERLLELKSVVDLATPNLIQRALESFVTIGAYRAHLRRSTLLYRKRRDAMLAAIARHMPGAECEVPQGGLFVWLALPDGVSSRTLLPRALRHGVSFAPGRDFFADRARGDRFVRLNFAAREAGVIEEGVRRLGRAMKGC